MVDTNIGRSSVFGQDGRLAATPRQMLDNPNVIADIVAQAVRDSMPGTILPSATAATGTGFYTSLTGDDLKVEGIGDRTEHNEYPMVRFSPGDLKEAKTRDIGGKFRISQEAIDAGDSTLIQDGIALIGANLHNVLDSMLAEALHAITEPDGDGQSMQAQAGWSGVSLSGADPTPESYRPWSDIVTAKRLLRRRGVNATATHLIVAEDVADELSILYGPASISEDWGIDVYASEKIPEGVGYLLDNNGLGNLITKAGVQVETWWDPAIRAHWAQSFVEPAIAISRPANIVRLSGLNGNVNQAINA